MNKFFKKKTIDIFKTAKDRYGIFPTTTWDISYSDKLEQKLKKQIGDGVFIHSDRQKDSSVSKDFTRTGSWKADRGKITESIFSPQIAQYIFSMFSPRSGLCFDPFGGGGTRAIIACKNGMDYLGYELRQEEVDAVRERLKNNNISNAKIICGNSQFCSETPENYADFLITCPPYYNLEMYDGGENDLSMCNTYQDFLNGMELVIRETYRILKEGSLSCWIVGLHREKDKNLITMHHDISSLHRKVGFNMKEEIIICHKNNGALQRVGNFEKGSNLLIRTHEYLLIFKKGYI